MNARVYFQLGWIKLNCVFHSAATAIAVVEATSANWRRAEASHRFGGILIHPFTAQCSSNLILRGHTTKETSSPPLLGFRQPFKPGGGTVKWAGGGEKQHRDKREVNNIPSSHFHPTSALAFNSTTYAFSLNFLGKMFSQVAGWAETEERTQTHTHEHKS